MRPVSPAHACLRQATASAHARLDGCFPQGLHDDASYRRYLQGMQGLLDALTAADAELGSRFVQHRQRLQQDLDAAGIANVPPPASMRVRGQAERLGARYVIEGSTLGARQLLRQVQTLGHVPDRGAAFLAYHVQHGRLHWPQLLDALAACDPGAADFPRLLQAARDTFALAATCFGQPRDTRGHGDGR